MKTKATFFYQFMVGFLSVFGLASPIADFIKERNCRSDMENLRNDWANVGGDITNAYEQYKSELSKKTC